MVKESQHTSILNDPITKEDSEIRSKGGKKVYKTVRKQLAEQQQ